MTETAGLTVLRHGETPPSFNACGYSGSRWALTKAVKEWKQILGVLCMEQRLPRGLKSCTVTATLTFPKNRRRDEGNYRGGVLEKALGDALVEYGALDDDTPDRYRFGALDFRVDRGVRCTEVCIAWTREDASGA